MRVWTATAAALFATGCGLVLDLSPAEPDAAVARMDAARPDAGRDAGRSMDAGEPDSGSEDVDAFVPPMGDGGPRDAGMNRPDAALIDDCEAVCTTPGFYCQRPEGSCIGPARCVPIADPSGAPCPDVVVCGCDRNTYSTPCAARAAGVNVATFSSCPTFEELGWCPEPEPPMGATWGCHPCFDEADCLDIPLATEWVCVGSACAPGGEGSCQPAGSLSDCYYDHECGAGETCVGPDIRVCVGSEFLTQGSCR